MTPPGLTSGADRIPVPSALVSVSPDLFEAIVRLTTEAILADLRNGLTVGSPGGRNRIDEADPGTGAVSTARATRAQGMVSGRLTLVPSRIGGCS